MNILTRMVRGGFAGWLILCSVAVYANEIRLVTAQQSRDFGSLYFEVSADVVQAYSQQQLRQYFPVYYGEFEVQRDTQHPSLLGHYSVSAERVVFKPRFPFTQGKVYTAFNLLKNNTFSFSVPQLTSPLGNRVKAIYPTAQALPANLLKIYIEFENPMQFGSAYDNIRLLDENGDTVPAPFLEIEQELWDAERKLFTLWLDPGRIKRDLSPNLLLGNPLKVEETYQLVITKNWQDVYSNTLNTDFVKHFSVTQYDREQPSEHTWRISYPKAGTQDPIVIQFLEHLDYGTLLNGFQVEFAAQRLEHSLSIQQGETEVWITPKTKWQRGAYQLFVNPRIEDLAGNNLNRLFDTDLASGQVSNKQRTEISVSFHIN